MKLRILSLITLLALLFTMIVACTQDPATNDGETNDSTDSTAAENPPVDPINIYTLNGTTGFGMAKLMNDAKGNASSPYSVTVKTDASEVTAALINGDVDIAALPTNAAANVYNKTQGGVKILAVNTLGCLYLLTKEGTTITSFADLKGKTVYAPAQNPTFIFTDLCKKNGLTPGTDITIDSTSYAQPANLRDAVASGTVDIAVLPEPMVTIAISSAKQNNVTITNAMDLTVEWDKVNEKGSLVQGCVVVRTAFLEKNPAAVEQFLKDYKASVEYLLANVTETSQMIEANGIFNKAAIAEKAIPKCNICYLDGAAMKAAMEVYLTALKGINANAIGGELPAEDFYYNAK